MKRFNFIVRYETRTVAIHGTATVVGDYDGPSKPEAMIRSALAKAADAESLVGVIPTGEEDRPEEVVVPPDVSTPAADPRARGRFMPGGRA